MQGCPSLPQRLGTDEDESDTVTKWSKLAEWRQNLRERERDTSVLSTSADGGVGSASEVDLNLPAVEFLDVTDGVVVHPFRFRIVGGVLSSKHGYKASVAPGQEGMAVLALVDGTPFELHVLCSELGRASDAEDLKRLFLGSRVGVQDVDAFLKRLFLGDSVGEQDAVVGRLSAHRLAPGNHTICLKMIDMRSLKLATDEQQHVTSYSSVEQLELLGTESEALPLHVTSHEVHCERTWNRKLSSDWQQYMDASCHGEDREVMSPAAFAQDDETHGCCYTSDGGIPLDLTMKAFLTQPYGVFVESGAYDGVLQSNTLIFERKFGWTGILIEPQATEHSDLRAALRANRPGSIIVNAALTNASLDGVTVTTAKARDNFHNLRSHVDWHSSVQDTTVVGLPTRGVTLSRLLDELRVDQIDFWSLDVEGFELMAVQGCDFRRHRPRFILIEVWEPTSAELRELMRDAGYALVRGYDWKGGLSGWRKSSSYRDFLWVDAWRVDHRDMFENLDAWLERERRGQG